MDRVRTMVAVSLGLLVTTVTRVEAQEWRLQEDLRIRGDNLRYQLGERQAIVSRSRDTIYALDMAAQQVRVFGPDGSLLQTIGRKGSGPGEFQGAASLGFVGDTLFVSDGILRRVTFFTLAGVVIQTKAFVYHDGEKGSPGQIAIQVLTGGQALTIPSRLSSEASSSPESTNPVVRFSQDGGADTLVLLRNGHPILSVPPSGYLRFQPFNDGDLFAFVQDGKSIVVASRKAADRSGVASYRVRRITTGGKTVVDATVEYTPEELPASAVEREISGAAGRFASFKSQQGSLIQAIRQGIFAPKYLPPLTAIIGGLDGTIWAQRATLDTMTVEWDVIGTQASVIARCHLPKRLSVRIVSDESVWGVLPDEDDVPQLVRYRIRK